MISMWQCTSSSKIGLIMTIGVNSKYFDWGCTIGLMDLIVSALWRKDCIILTAGKIWDVAFVRMQLFIPWSFIYFKIVFSKPVKCYSFFSDKILISVEVQSKWYKAVLSDILHLTCIRPLSFFSLCNTIRCLLDKVSWNHVYREIFTREIPPIIRICRTHCLVFV